MMSTHMNIEYRWACGCAELPGDPITETGVCLLCKHKYYRKVIMSEENFFELMGKINEQAKEIDKLKVPYVFHMDAGYLC